MSLYGKLCAQSKKDGFVNPPIASAPEVPPVLDISEEFSKTLKGLGALTTVYNLLQKGTFTYDYRFALDQSISFIQSLHNQSTDNALLHPESDKVPELVALKEARAKAEIEQTIVVKAEEKRAKKAVKRKKNV